MPPDRGLLLLDWPSEQRPGVDVRIDGQRQEVPSSGFVEYALPPGTHRLQMHRPGYEPIDEQILVPVGRRREYRPEWLALRASSPAGLRGIFGSEAGPSVPAPLPPQETPALRMDGPVRVEPRPGQGIAAPVLATVQPVLLGEGIGPLAPSLKGNLTVGCTVLEIGKHGARSIELRNLEYEKVAKILAGTLRVDVRFNFVRRGGDSLDSNQRVAESEWHTINPLQAGCNHVVRMELSRQQVQQLRALGQAVAPR